MQKADSAPEPGPATLLVADSATQAALCNLADHRLGHPVGSLQPCRTPARSPRRLLQNSGGCIFYSEPGRVPRSTDMGTDQAPNPQTLPDVDSAFRALSPVVLRMARKAGFTDADQREVVQKVGLVLAEKLGELDETRGSLRRWAAGVARNIILDMRRQLRQEASRLDRTISVMKVPATSLTPEETLRAREALWILRTTVHSEDRAVFELDALGCDASEIGEQLGLPPSTVEWKLKEARKTLRRALARLREDRSEASRVRGIWWPFAFARDLAAAVRGDRDAGGWGRALVRGLLLTAVPALLSVHLVTFAPEAASAEETAWIRAAPAAVGSAETRPPMAPESPSGTATAARDAQALPPSGATRAAPPIAAPARTPARTFGGRRWMTYREILRGGAPSGSPPGDRVPGEQP